MKTGSIEFMIAIILGILFLFCAKDSRADEESVWLTTGEWSRHNEQDKHHYRQNNTGVGIQYDVNSDASALVGYYENSIHRSTFYMGMTYTPWHFGNAKIGVMGAMATGYTEVIPAIPIASLYGTYEHGRFGANFYWLPTVVVAVQLKVRGW